LTIPVAKCLSSLVAAGCIPIRDADPSMDFIAEDDFELASVRSCASTPKAIGNLVLEVLTICLSSLSQTLELEVMNLEFAEAHLLLLFIALSNRMKGIGK